MMKKNRKSNVMDDRSNDKTNTHQQQNRQQQRRRRQDQEQPWYNWWSSISDHVHHKDNHMKEDTVATFSFIQNELSRVDSENKKLNQRQSSSTSLITDVDNDIQRLEDKHDENDNNDPPKRWIDFFCIVGLDDKQRHQVISNDKHDNGKIVCIPSLLDSYPKPRIVNTATSKYVSIEFPQQLPTFCFPNGCTVMKRKAEQHSHNIPEPTICTMVLTSSNGQRLYMTTLTVYEKLQPSIAIDDDINHNVELQNKPAKKSVATLLQPKEDNATDYSNTQESNMCSATNTTTDDASSSNCHCFWIPKCIVLLSHYPIFHIQATILKELYYTIQSNTSPIPIERYIAHVVHDIPFPSKNVTKATQGKIDNNKNHDVVVTVEWTPWTGSDPLRFEIPQQQFILSSSLRTTTSRHYSVTTSISYEPLFRTLSLSNILVLWATLLQERKVVLSCHPNNVALLTPIAEAILSLLFPLVWNGIYIPILPTSTSNNTIWDILDAPVPYLIGLTTTHNDQMQNCPHYQHPVGVVWCDLDHDTLHLGWNDDGTPVDTLPSIPEAPIMRLTTELEEIVDPYYLATIDGIKGKMTVGDRTNELDNATRQPYAQRSRLFQRNNVSCQPFSRSYILSQSSKIPPRQKPLRTEDYVLLTTTAEEKEETGTKLDITSFLLGLTTKNSNQFIEEKKLENEDELHSKTGIYHSSNRQINENNQIVTSLMRQGRSIQAHADRFWAVVGTQAYATPSAYAIKGDHTLFGNDVLNKQDEIAAKFFDVTEQCHEVATRTRQCFDRFLVSILSRHDFYVDPNTQQLQVDRFVRSSRLPPKQQEFIRTVVNTQMFHSFLQDRNRRHFFNKLVKQSHNREESNTRETTYMIIQSPLVYGPPVSEKSPNNDSKKLQIMDRRFPDILNVDECISNNKMKEEKKANNSFYWKKLLCCSY